MVNIANSKTSSKKRKRSKSKSILKASSNQAESLNCSADSAAVFSEGIQSKYGFIIYRRKVAPNERTVDPCFSVSSRSSDDDLFDRNIYRCDMCRKVFRSSNASEPLTCETCDKNYKAANNSCLCKGVMNDVIKTMISCEICQSWYHQTCVGVCNSVKIPYFNNSS